MRSSKNRFDSSKPYENFSPSFLCLVVDFYVITNIIAINNFPKSNR